MGDTYFRIRYSTSISNTKKMRLLVGLILSVALSKAIPVTPNNGGRKDIQLTERVNQANESTVYMYPVEFSRFDWHYFNSVECTGRGHRGVASRDAVLEYRSDRESVVDSGSSWTPAGGWNKWLQIGTMRSFPYGS